MILKHRNRKEHILCSLIALRCLSEDMIKNYIYENSVKKKDYYRDIKELLDSKFIASEVIEPPYLNTTTKVFYPTTLGIHHVKKNNLIDGIEYKNAAKLHMHPKMLRHQFLLNDFVLDMYNQWKIKNSTTDFDYDDLIYIPAEFKDAKLFMPDGVLYVNNQIYFLESDTGKETGASLRNRFESYRKYFAHIPETYRNKIQTSLFILGSKNYVVRGKNILATGYKQLVANAVNYNCIAGHKDDLISYVLNDNFDMSLGKDFLQSQIFVNNHTKLLKDPFYDAIAKEKYMDETGQEYSIRYDILLWGCPSLKPFQRVYNQAFLSKYNIDQKYLCVFYTGSEYDSCLLYSALKLEDRDRYLFLSQDLCRGTAISTSLYKIKYNAFENTYGIYRINSLIRPLDDNNLTYIHQVNQKLGRYRNRAQEQRKITAQKKQQDTKNNQVFSFKRTYERNRIRNGNTSYQ